MHHNNSLNCFSVTNKDMIINEDGFETCLCVDLTLQCLVVTKGSHILKHKGHTYFNIIPNTLKVLTLCFESTKENVRELKCIKLQYNQNPEVFYKKGVLKNFAKFKEI